MRKVLPQNAKLVPEDAKRVFKGIIYDVYHWRQKVFDGSYETFEMLKRPDSIIVLAVKDDKIVIQEEEQPHYGSFLTLPGGRHDVSEEDELMAAKRELREETGMSFKKWKLLSVMQPHAHIEAFIYIFLATEFEAQVDPKLDAGEKIDVDACDFAELKDLVLSGKVRTAAKDLLIQVNSLDELQSLPSVG